MSSLYKGEESEEGRLAAQVEGGFVQGMGWTCLEELVWGDAEHKWLPPGVLHTRGPGERTRLGGRPPCRSWLGGAHRRASSEVLATAEAAAWSGQCPVSRPGRLWCLRWQRARAGMRAGTYKIPTANDIPLDLRVTLLRDAPCARTPQVHSSKAVGEPPLFLGASVFFALKARRCPARCASDRKHP